MAWSKPGGGGGSGATKLIQLTDVVTTNKATDTTLKVNVDGNHEYVPFPAPGSATSAEKVLVLPDADIANHGRIVALTEGTESGASELYWCKMLNGGTYDWVQIG